MAWLNKPDTYVDITATIDIKLKSLEQHVSQGTADAEPWVRLRAEEAGKEAGCTTPKVSRRSGSSTTRWRSDGRADTAAGRAG